MTTDATAAMAGPADLLRGEEFREDGRRHGNLPAALVKRLSVIDPWRATRSLAETWGLMALAGVLATVWWHPAVVLPCMLLIASRQHALFVLTHDAAHYRLYRRRWLNDLAGRVCASATGISMCAYRVVHRLHHNHLYQPQDPDIPIHAGYPRGRAYLARKLLRDLCGLTAPKTYAYFFGVPAPGDGQDGRNRPLDDTSPALRGAALRDRWVMVAWQVTAPLLAWSTGLLVEYLVLWVLPLLTLLQPVLRFRAICEHGAVPGFDSPLQAARTNTGPGWLLWLLFPHQVNHHIEHHMYPSVPHYNLPACHREMVARGILDGAEVVPLGETVGKVFAERVRPAGAAA